MATPKASPDSPLLVLEVRSSGHKKKINTKLQLLGRAAQAARSWHSSIIDELVLLVPALFQN